MWKSDDAGRLFLAAIGRQLGSGTVWLSANRETTVTLVTSLLRVLTISWASCQYVPLRASTCDGVRVRGLCMNPFTLVGAGLLNPSPWPARVPRCPAHGRTLGPIAVSSLAARLLCPGVVQKRPLPGTQPHRLQVSSSLATASIMASGGCSRNLTPSIHPPLYLSSSRCVTPTFPALAAAPAAPAAPAALASLAFDASSP